MSLMVISKLKTGLIFGDNENAEYVYLPASEIGAAAPLCIYEAAGRREDVNLAEAETLIRRLSLKPVCHPRLGRSTC